MLALDAAGDAQHVLGGVVHLDHVQLAVHGDEAVEHVVDDGFQLCALVLQLFHGLLQARVHGLQGAQELVELRIAVDAEVDVVVSVDDGLCRLGDLVDRGDDAPGQRKGEVDAHHEHQHHQRGEQPPVPVAEDHLAARDAQDRPVIVQDGYGDLHLRQPPLEGDLRARPVGEGGHDIGLVQVIAHLAAGVVEDLPAAVHAGHPRVHERRDAVQRGLILCGGRGVARRVEQLLLKDALLLLHGNAHREKGGKRHHQQNQRGRRQDDPLVHGFHASCSLSTKR